MIWAILLGAWLAFLAWLAVAGEIRYQRYRRAWEQSHPGLNFEDWNKR